MQCEHVWPLARPRVNINMLATAFVLCLLPNIGEFSGFDVNDILNADYLPGTLFFENSVVDNNSSASHPNSSAAEGAFGDAFLTMGYHRKMMNEYLCRNYLAEEILSDVVGPRVEKRSGKPRVATKKEKKKPLKVDLSGVKDSMMEDQGSSNYQNWLTRTATLEDIYRHYGNNNVASRRDGSIPDDVSEDEFDGEVTGYAMQPAQPSGYHSTYHPEAITKQSGVSYGGTGHGGHEVYDGWVHDPHDKEEKGMAIKDLFELALTAIAFLAFKLFLLNVIMCFVQTNNTTMVALPAGAAVRNRTLRAIRGTPRTSYSTLDEMSRRVLTAIEAFLTLQADNGICLQRSLCENNKYSRTLEENQKIWLPVWSLGASYIAGRFASGVSPSSLMLENLRASVLGLGASQCETLYPACTVQSLGKAREARRRHHRRRRFGDVGN